jgi:hypothetical protein
MTTIKTIPRTTITSMTRTEQLIWCAGFFDARGRIQTAKPTNSDAIALTITVNNTSWEALELFKQRIGGGGIIIINRNARSSQYRWQQSGWGVGELLSIILPWLILKRPQAILAIELANTISLTRNTVTPAVIARRGEIAEEIKKLKELAKES